MAGRRIVNPGPYFKAAAVVATLCWGMTLAAEVAVGVLT